jgi:hypothetical protein
MNAKRFFLLFLLCALVPLATAKLSLSLGWFTAGATNKGLWMTHEAQLIPSITTGDLHWTIAYVNAKECKQNCVEALTLLQQLYTGLGRKQLGVQTMFISGESSHNHLQQSFPRLKIRHSPKDLTPFEHHFVIINQQGIALLRYPLSGSLPARVASDLRSDLLRLFNYDRSRL